MKRRRGTSFDHILSHRWSASFLYPAPNPSFNLSFRIARTSVTAARSSSYKKLYHALHPLHNTRNTAKPLSCIKRGTEEPHVCLTETESEWDNEVDWGGETKKKRTWHCFAARLAVVHQSASSVVSSISLSPVIFTKVLLLWSSRHHREGDGHKDIERGVNIGTQLTACHFLAPRHQHRQVVS